jgi:hypothetical protein
MLMGTNTARTVHDHMRRCKGYGGLVKILCENLASTPSLAIHSQMHILARSIECTI